MSNNLNLDQLTEDQAAKEATVSTALGQLDAAVTEALSVDLSGGDATVTLANYRRAVALVLTGATVARTVTLPASKKLSIVRNAGAFDATLTVGTTTAVVPAGGLVMAYTDGSTNGLAVMLPGAGGGGGGASRAFAHFRLHLDDTQGGANFGIAEIAIKDEAGVVGTFSSATASSTFSVFVPANCFDSDLSTIWFSGTGVNTNVDFDITYTTAFVADTLVITTSDSSGQANRAPNNIHIYGSDDGTTWILLGAVTLPTASTASQELSVSVPKIAGPLLLSTLNDVDFSTPPTDGQFLAYDNTSHKWHPVDAPSGGGGGGGGGTRGSYDHYRIVMDSPTYYVGISELYLRSSIGGSNITPSASTASTTVDGAVANLYDGSSSTFWASNNTAARAYVDFTYSTAFVVEQLSITNRPTSPEINQAPYSLEVYGSTDGVVFERVSAAALAWSTAPQTNVVALT